MATIKICDRCGSRIYQKENITYVKLYNHNVDMQREYELRWPCAAQLRALLKPTARIDGSEGTE